MTLYRVYGFVCCAYTRNDGWWQQQEEGCDEAEAAVPVPVERLHQSVLARLHPQSAHAEPHGREAIQVYLQGLRQGVRAAAVRPAMRAAVVERRGVEG